MKIRWLEEKVTREEIEAVTGKKVLRITSGDLDTEVEGETVKGIEIEFDEEVPDSKLKLIDNLLPKLKRITQLEVT